MTALSSRDRVMVAAGALAAALMTIALNGCAGAPAAEQQQDKKPAQWAATPTRPGVLPALLEIMKHDDVFESVLSERVKLRTGAAEGAAALPRWAEEELLDPADADTLRELRRLMPADEPLRSGRHVALAGTVLGVALRCVTFKRAAVHVALLARLMALLGADDGAARPRLAVAGNLLVRGVDVLTAAGAAYGQLLDVYTLTVKPAAAEPMARDAVVEGLRESAARLNAAIAESCVVADMREYAPALDLVAADGRHRFGAESVTADQRVDDAVPLDAVLALLRANENMALDAADRVPMLRTADMDVWRTLLDVPDMPRDPKDFERRPQTMTARKREEADARARALREQKTARTLAAAADQLSRSHGDDDADGAVDDPANPIPLQLMSQ